jgi:SAM-dependent methyltransferase
VVEPCPPTASPCPGVSYVTASAEAIPFEAGSFDAILFSHALHHLPDPAAALTEAARVAAPDARLLIRAATHADLRALPHARWMRRVLDGILASTPDREDLQRWVSGAGWVDPTWRTLETPQTASLDAYAETVQLQAFREWALSPDGGPDPRAAARDWVMSTFDAAPPVQETLMTARKP